MRCKPAVFLIAICFFSVSHAKLYFGIDLGSNSLLGFTAGGTYMKSRLYGIVHLDAGNEGAGFAALAYRFRVKKAYIPIGITMIGGGVKNDSKGALGFYTGYQRELSHNTMLYIDACFTPVEFKYRNVQNISLDIGLSFAPFHFLKDLFSSGERIE